MSMGEERFRVGFALLAWAGVVGCGADRQGFGGGSIDPSAVDSGGTDAAGTSSGASTTGTSGASTGGSSGTSTSSGGTTSSSSSSSSSGASSSSSSSSSSGASDAGPCPTCALKVQFKQENGTSTTTTNAHLDFNIVNMGTAVQDMDEITLEFFFTAQGVLTTPTVDCYQVSLGACPSPVSASSSSLEAVFRSYRSTTSTADSLMLLAFSGISIPAGGSLVVRVGLHNMTSTGNFDLTKDYSFTAADSAFADAPNIPLYYNGLLLWGQEP
jgi:hypothetical protein